eukprot:6205395-Pleurochrysis_carterae.AAC.1
MFKSLVRVAEDERACRSSLTRNSWRSGAIEGAATAVAADAAEAVVEAAAEVAWTAALEVIRGGNSSRSGGDCCIGTLPVARGT